MAQPGRFSIKWYTKELLAEMRGINAAEEKAAAQRIMKRIHKKVPVSGGQHSTTKARRIKKYKFNQQWRTRRPGRLKSSIRLNPSKFKDGGHLVFVGGHIPYYAYWVERGTVFTYKLKYGRKGEQYMKKSVDLERARFIRNMRKRYSI